MARVRQGSRKFTNDHAHTIRKFDGNMMMKSHARSLDGMHKEQYGNLSIMGIHWLDKLILSTENFSFDDNNNMNTASFNSMHISTWMAQQNGANYMQSILI